MIYDVSITAIVIFVVFVAIVLGLSFYFGNKTKSSSGYYAAGGNIHWAVNGIAFAGDYLSAASFLGICGMIAFVGYDGFVYSIGYLAGWVVALFLVAEPLKRYGKYTFTDALDYKFNSRAIQLTAAISTLIVSVFYLIPQMVGAGTLIMPLLGFPHWVGVIMVGVIVIIIVATAGMTSTTYVQFIKGGLLIIITTIITIYILKAGYKTTPGTENLEYHKFVTLSTTVENGELTSLSDSTYKYVSKAEAKGKTFVCLEKESVKNWYELHDTQLVEVLSTTSTPDGKKLYNGEPKENGKFYQVGHLNKIVYNGEEVNETGPLGPFEYLSTLQNSEIVRFTKVNFEDNGDKVTVYQQNITSGQAMLTPGLKFKIGGDAPLWEKINFISLMIALFLGTASLPHVLIRYYTVPSQKAARKSTILAIAAIGFFYVLTLYLGLGSAVNGVLDVEDSNMAGPLLAKAFGVGLFAIVSALAFATILGTVSGLIVASSGAIAHDFIDNYLKKNLSDKAKIRAGRISAFVVGFIAILLGIVFEGVNVSFLVGWAFSVAASANLPAILMLLFWKKTTYQGIAWSIVVGIVTSMGIILTSPSMWEIYGLAKADAPHVLDSPAIISFTLALLTVYFVSLATQKKTKEA